MVEFAAGVWTGMCLTLTVTLILYASFVDNEE